MTVGARGCEEKAVCASGCEEEGVCAGGCKEVGVHGTGGGRLLLFRSGDIFPEGLAAI